MIRMFDYLRTLAPIEEEIVEAVRRVLHSGRLILGPETEEFEKEFAACIGVKHCIGVSSGTTALHLALFASGVGAGDEVVTVSNTCVPTVSAIELTGATPVFVDVQETDLMMDPTLVAQAITERTKCILPVHLWGQCVDMEGIRLIADQTGIPVIEDCAQAQGARFRSAHAGTMGLLGCFSFYPTKNLGAYGDAGAVVTDDDQLATQLRRKRMYGYTRRNYSEEPGMNARISEIQAAILRIKLRYLAKWLERRREIAARYHEEIQNPLIRLPFWYPDRLHAYHQFVVRCKNRVRLIEALEQAEIDCDIHYPTPIHRMPVYERLDYHLPVSEKASKEILSIPIHESLSDAEVETIIAVLNQV